jgi:hypothetical protein
MGIIKKVDTGDEIIGGRMGLGATAPRAGTTA